MWYIKTGVRNTVTDQRRLRYNIIRVHVCSEINFWSTISAFCCPFHWFTTRHLTATEYCRTLIGKCVSGPQWRHLGHLFILRHGTNCLLHCIVVVLTTRKKCNHRSAIIYIYILYSRRWPVVVIIFRGMKCYRCR